MKELDRVWIALAFITTWNLIVNHMFAALIFGILSFIFFNIANSQKDN